MDRRFQQTLNFNFNDVPVRFNLSSNQPLPENFVSNTVRTLVRNASSAVGIGNDGTNEQPQNPASSPDIQPPVSANTESSSSTTVPNSTSIQMWNSDTSATNLVNRDSTSTSLRTGEVQATESVPHGTTDGTNGPTNETPGNRVNNQELFNTLLPIVISASRILVVLFGKSLSGFILNILLCLGLLYGYYSGNEALKRSAYSDQINSTRLMRTALKHCFINATGLLLALWLYVPRDPLNVLFYNVDVGEVEFFSAVTAVFTLNFIVKSFLLMTKFTICVLIRCKSTFLPYTTNIFNFVDVFGHAYLCSIVVTFWYVIFFPIYWPL